MLFDIFSRTQPVLIRPSDKEMGRYYDEQNSLQWNPDYLGQHPAGDSTTVLAHELVHAWLDGSSDLPKNTKVDGWVRMGEIYAVQGENQIANEIFANGRGRREDYSGVPVPDEDLFLQVSDTKCCDMFKEW